MVNKLIKTEKEYNLALSKIESLMDAKEDSHEADELELLSTLVEMYEDKHFEIELPDPIEAIKFRIDQLGLDRRALEPIIGSKGKVSEVLGGKRSLTLSMMRALNKDLGIPAEILLQKPGANFPSNFSGLKWDRFPISEMVKRGWIKTKDYKNRAEESIREFIKACSVNQMELSEVLFRKTRGSRENSKMNTYSLLAWCLKVISTTRNSPLKKKYHNDLSLELMRDIARLSYFEDGPKLAQEFLAKQGIHLIIERHLPKTYLDGAAMLLNDGTAIIGLTLRYDRVDNFWFSLLHEIAHLKLHLSKDKPCLFIDDFDLRKHHSEDSQEEDADNLAQTALIPEKIWQSSPARKEPTYSNVIALSENLKISPSIIAGRIRYERNNYKLLSRSIASGKVRKHFPNT